ncbi:HAMP domain-containing histidine kinase [Virgibacillus necropolis]|uniref:HAMP domain-containing sensor histidine kinase n=1 Tax=Virgibacillus necropolis TaxID=163877 RepID=UPI003850E6CD
MNKQKNNILKGAIGFILLTYGLIIPVFIKDWSLYIISNINQSISLHDSGRLLITSFSFAAKYVLIFLFIYFGSMLISSFIIRSLESVAFSYLFILITMLTIFLYNQIYHEQISYMSNLLSIGILLTLHHFIPKQKYFLGIYFIILFFILTAFQWLQLIPALSNLGIGTNDIAVSLKIADMYFTGNQLFNTLGTIFFIAFIIIAIIFTTLIHLINKQLYTLRKYQEQEEELEETRVALGEKIVYEEINTLVHDLKTPLVTVEGLTSLIQMKFPASKENSTITTYFMRMDNSIEKMKDMISEILYENIKQPIEVKELLAYVTSHLELDKQEIELEINLENNLPTIYINKIRFARALSNILENAITSFAGKAGFIDIHVKRLGNSILFRIHDNGPGIPPSHLKSIWEDGFSTKKSSGIGLTFVKRIVENHNGRITVSSIPGTHTQMNIILPIHKEGEISERNRVNS